MLYYIFYELLFNEETWCSIFRVFRYITFRSVYAALSSFLICIILGPWIIKKLKERNISKKVIKDYYPISHHKKQDVPTMGGLIILVSLIVSSILWVRLNNRFFWIIMFSIVGFGILGLLDDYLKYKGREIKASHKLIWQIILAGIIAVFLYWNSKEAELSTFLNLPFFKIPPINLYWGYIPFVILVIVASSNAVNITDGLDGLAIGALVFACLAFSIICYVSGHAKFADYLNIIHIVEAGELTVFMGALVGTGLGFLWFNTYPAQVFMGDTGSLALGGALGTIAVLTKHELVLLLIGGLFVIEAGSVIVQVAYFKLKKKRIFNMAPLHHHFELKGWPEPKIIVRFWIIASIFTLLSLSTLKLR
ncbi:MAG: phospho-N-acetylmuramoyl-pentapeptide-transferase [bacterium]|nr:phospho-N-acetylmuramoyl-pentapeptide-transferase [bacterium]